nr:unnamed protein product [Callosobruchus chinensis]
MCFFGCHNDDDCASTESCIDNKCANPCGTNPCGPNAICTVSNHRATCSCGEGFVANPSAKVACVRAPAQPCKENRECQRGNICTEGFCRTICSSDKNCLSNERCEISVGVCKPICRKDDDCRNDEVCEGLICTIGCRSDSKCPSDAACVNNKCVDLCSAPTGMTQRASIKTCLESLEAWKNWGVTKNRRKHEKSENIGRNKKKREKSGQ